MLSASSVFKQTDHPKTPHAERYQRSPKNLPDKTPKLKWILTTCPRWLQILSDFCKRCLQQLWSNKNGVFLKYPHADEVTFTRKYIHTLYYSYIYIQHTFNRSQHVHFYYLHRVYTVKPEIHHTPGKFWHKVTSQIIK